MFYLTMHSTHFIYGYMASDIWLRTILIVRKETCCRHIGYSFLSAARVLLYTPSHRQDDTYHGLCYTSRGALAGTRNSSNGYMASDTWLRTILIVRKEIPTTCYLLAGSDSPRREMTSRVVFCLGGEATARPIPAEIYLPCCGRRHSLSAAKSSAETQTHLFNDTGNTFYLWLYGVGYNGEKKPAVTITWASLFK